jgi:gas vesicle protein
MVPTLQRSRKRLLVKILSAGSSTKDATKKTGSATKKETKKAVNKSAEKTDEGPKKVEDETQPR